MPDYLSALFSQGGPVIPYILLLSVLMWVLILEHYWFIILQYPQLFARVQQEWNRRAEYRSRTARRLRAQKIASLSACTPNPALYPHSYTGTAAARSARHRIRIDSYIRCNHPAWRQQPVGDCCGDIGGACGDTDRSGHSVIRTLFQRKSGKPLDTGTGAG